MKKLLLALNAFGISFGLAYAMDSLSPGAVVFQGSMSGGVICNTEAEVRDAITNYGRPDYVFPEGCGILEGVAFGRAVLIEDIVFKGRVFRLVKYTFIPNETVPVTQFGVWRTEPLGQTT